MIAPELSSAELGRAVSLVNYLRWRFPAQEWAINTRDELLSAIIYAESLDG